MDINDYLLISSLINNCPNCSSSIVGGDNGSLGISDEIISRTCACGFDFSYDARRGVTKKKVKEAIDKSLKIVPVLGIPLDYFLTDLATRKRKYFHTLHVSMSKADTAQECIERIDMKSRYSELISIIEALPANEKNRVNALFLELKGEHLR